MGRPLYCPQCQKKRELEQLVIISKPSSNYKGGPEQIGGPWSQSPLFQDTLNKVSQKNAPTSNATQKKQNKKSNLISQLGITGTVILLLFIFVLFF